MSWTWLQTFSDVAFCGRPYSQFVDYGAHARDDGKNRQAKVTQSERTPNKQCLFSLRLPTSPLYVYRASLVCFLHTLDNPVASLTM